MGYSSSSCLLPRLKADFCDLISVFLEAQSKSPARKQPPVSEHVSWLTMSKMRTFPLPFLPCFNILLILKRALSLCPLPQSSCNGLLPYFSTVVLCGQLPLESVDWGWDLAGKRSCMLSVLCRLNYAHLCCCLCPFSLVTQYSAFRNTFLFAQHFHGWNYTNYSYVASLSSL